ncbi:ABC transporter substrate-binding protein [Desulfatitalea tepidiphila]|uniref:ABC transporter substrate-binding protein n=1 Tax=Desulfatitalea tepidiphila TaxID=1185843 RepID=UPI0006B503BA|nr:cobalamin-binding protein [Desulfatitalea tepidiphila]
MNRVLRHIAGIAAVLVIALAGAAPAEKTPMRTVVDLTGRIVNVPHDPRRVVALAPSVTEIVFALGREDRLAGVTRFSNYPPAAQQLSKIGSYIHLDVERIVALRPDLCIAVKDGNPIAAVEQLEALGLPVFAVNPLDLETVMQSVEAIGGLIDAAAVARDVVADMRQRIVRVEAKVAQTPLRPGVFLQIGISPIVSVGSSTFIHTLIEMAGGTNLAAGPTPYPRFSREQVIALAPEVIVISSMARDAVFEQVKAEWMQWPVIPAVRRNAVFIAPPDLFDRPSPRLVDALEVLAGLIHPNLFEARP